MDDDEMDEDEIDDEDIGEDEIHADGRGLNSDSEADYVCDACGEAIVIPLDVTAGGVQEYVEDCPVCCHPNVLRIEIDQDAGHIRVDARGEFL